MKNLLILLIFPLFIFSQSIYDKLPQMDKDELKITRNTVYAKHGREFETSSMKEYFNSQIWYKINPNYSDDMLSNEDKNLINIIRIWENSILLEQEKLASYHFDNRRYVDYPKETLEMESANAYLLFNKKTKYLYFLIEDSYFKLKTDFEKLNIKDLNFRGIFGDTNNTNVFIFDVALNECFNDSWDEMGVFYSCDWNHLIISFKNKKFEFEKVLTHYNKYFIGSDEGNYIEEPYFIFELQYCDWERGQSLSKKYIDIKIDGSISSSNYLDFQYPKGTYRSKEVCNRICGCAACFDGNSKVLVNKSDFTLIKDLKIGQKILSYDFDSDEYFEASILDLVKVKHDNLVELYFNHDTIISTDDHPYFVVDKYWSSFSPNATEFNYTNYEKVNKIEVGDMFVLSDGELTKLLGFSYLNDSRDTYTITKLDKGNTFFVNGILVGVEEIRKHNSAYFKK